MDSSSVKLISVTSDAEETMAYCARVSSPFQDNPSYARLFAYMIKHGHWSPFEMATMVLEINTSRMISQQILRHRSFSFQEFSQRYAAATEAVIYPARRQDDKNRQNSIDDLDEETRVFFERAQEHVHRESFYLYELALEMGIAKEQARALLPLSTATKLYMSGTARSWIHYIGLRTHESTQLEHKEIADQCKAIFVEEFSTISEALGWA